GRALWRAARASGRPRPAPWPIIRVVSPKPANSTLTTATPTTKARPKPKRKAKRRRSNPALAWARRLARYRPRLLEDTLDSLTSIYGPQIWRRRLDPTSELILTIL